MREERAQIALRHFSFGRTGVTEAAIAADVAGDRAISGSSRSWSCGIFPRPGPQGIDEDFLKGISGVTPGLEIEEWNEAFTDELEAQSEDEDYESAIDADGKLASDLKLPGRPGDGDHRDWRRRDADEHADARRGPRRDRAGRRARTAP